MKSVVTTVVVVLAVLAADAALAASAAGTAGVRIEGALSLAQTQSLDLGAVTSGAAGSVSIAPTGGAHRVSGGVGAVAADPGRQAVFQLSGQPNSAIMVSVGSAITGLGGGISGVTTIGPLPTALGSGTVSFTVGATLDIPAKTAAGAHSGVYTVAVNYP